MIIDHIKSFFNLVNRGRQGLNVGITTGLPKLDRLVSGIQRSTFYLIAGGTGSGKTTLCLYSFIYEPLKIKLGDPSFRIIYYSLEMTAEMLYAKLLSMYIYFNYGVAVTYSEIFSRDEIIDDYKYSLILASEDWLEKVKEHLIIYDKTLTPKGLYASLKTYAEQHGYFEDSGDGYSTKYIANDPNETVLVIIDHLFLMRPVNGQNKKEMADEAVEYLIQFRNKCGYSPIPLQQLNRLGSGMDRRKEGMQLPELQDLKGTGGAAEAAEVVIALFNPLREKINNWEGYDIRKLRDKIRGLCILKNRYGEVDKVLPVNFFGNVNIFRELPKPDELSDNGYGPYVDLFYTADTQEDKYEEDDEKSSPFVL